MKLSGQDHTVQDKQPETFPKSRSRYGHGTLMVHSRSRFKNERNTVERVSIPPFFPPPIFLFT
jgi:hypothetical protein